MPGKEDRPMNRTWGAALVGLGAAIAGTFAFAAPAAADVNVSPQQLARGGGAELTFTIPEERPGAYTTKVELDLPESTPVAEMYALSVDAWAPDTVMRKLDHPLDLIHGSSATNEVPASMTWTYVADAPPATPKPFDLRVALGPMPQADQMAFTLVQTYSDGTVVRYADAPGANGEKADHPAAVVKLSGDAPAGAVHGDEHGGDPASGDDTTPVAQTAKTDDGGYGVLGAFLIVGVVLGVGIDGWFIVRSIRRRTA
jgi:uncharacterized protein YcnI